MDFKPIQSKKSPQYFPFIILMLLSLLAIDVVVLTRLNQKDKILDNAPSEYWRESIEKKQLLEEILAGRIQSALDRMLGRNNSVATVTVILQTGEQQEEAVTYDPQKLTRGSSQSQDYTTEQFATEEGSKSKESESEKTSKQITNESGDSGSTSKEVKGTSVISGTGVQTIIQAVPPQEEVDLPGFITSPKKSYIGLDLPGFPKIFSREDDSVYSPGGDSSGQKIKNAQENMQDALTSQLQKRQAESQTIAPESETAEQKEALSKTAKTKEVFSLNDQDDYYILNSTTRKKILPPGQIERMFINVAIKDIVYEQVKDRLPEMEGFLKNMIGYDGTRNDTFILIPYSKRSAYDRLFWTFNKLRIPILILLSAVCLYLGGILAIRWFKRYKQFKKEQAEELRRRQEQELRSSVEDEFMEQKKVEEQEKVKIKKEAIFGLAEEDTEMFSRMLDTWIGVEIDK